MNKHTKWRLDFAHRLFNKIKITNNLKAFFIGGSVSRNLADEYSDLEICFVWEKPISISQRKKILFDLQIEFDELIAWENKEKPFEETVFFNEFQIDIWHLTTNILDKTIQVVIVDFEINISKSNLLYTIQSCITLYGNYFIENYKKKINNYPKTLAKNIIIEHSKMFYKVDVDLQIQRKEWHYVYRNIGAYLKQVYLVLEAINMQYHKGFKKIPNSLLQMKFKPKSAFKIYSKLDKLSLQEAWSEVLSLKKETIELIKIHFPKIDITYLENNKINRRKKTIIL